MTGTDSIKLSELTRQVQKTIQGAFAGQSYWVVADVTNYSLHSAKNYHYFDLVEKAADGTVILAKISAAAWGTGHTQIREFERITGQQFKNDINVLLRVMVEYHPVHGLKLSVLEVDPNFTIGLLEQQRQLTIERLLRECAAFIRKDGDTFYTRNKSLELRRVIQRIAVVTSSASAGLQDFCHTTDNNPYGYRFTIDKYHTTVQGQTSSTEIYNVLLEIHNSRIDYDAVVIIRGGGAQTDFLVFDQYPLCRIVAKYPIPIITGIGHQKNETIVDLLAHTSTKTPTQAAEFIIGHNRRFEDQLTGLQKNILIKAQQRFSLNFQSLATLNSQVVNSARTNLAIQKDQLVKVNQLIVNTTRDTLYDRHRRIVSLSTQILSKPSIMVHTRLSDLDNMLNNMKSYIRVNFNNQRGYIGHFGSIFKMMHPDNILKKGFAIIKKDGKIMSDPGQIEPGANISIILSDKELHSTVNSKNDYHGDEFNL